MNVRMKMRMSKAGKRFFSFFCAALLLCAMPVSAQAAGDASGNEKGTETGTVVLDEEAMQEKAAFMDEQELQELLERSMEDAQKFDCIPVSSEDFNDDSTIGNRNIAIHPA